MSLVLFLVASFSAAVLGGFSPPDGWFDSLNKPSWNPPGWVFGPVWTVLYAMIGTSGWLVWRDHGSSAIRWALALWLIQLLLNAAWSPTFFGMHRPGLALVIICAMWLTIAATIVAFWPLQRTAAYLLLPYLAWVTFATVLNTAIWRLNAG
ncbi:MAG: tryptophan-rich sensory protein [Bradymonadia bacterium]|jgi:tryptophan-rich sensory protein